MAAKLLGIDHDGPVDVFDWTGSVYKIGEKFGTFEPSDFEKVVEFINRNGGPAFWTVEVAE